MTTMFGYFQILWIKYPLLDSRCQLRPDKYLIYPVNFLVTEEKSVRKSKAVIGLTHQGMNFLGTLDRVNEELGEQEHYLLGVIVY